MKTSRNLLSRAKDDRNSVAWSRLVGIYDPLISGWLRRAGVEEGDVSDITQEVLYAVVTELKKFEHNGRTGAFRNWLRRITINRCRRYWDVQRKHFPADRKRESNEVLDQLADPNSELTVRWDREHDHYVVNRILELIRPEFDDKTIAAFYRVAIKKEPAKTIAQDLSVSAGQVYKFKFRVMRRLQEEAQGLVNNEQVPALFESLSDSKSSNTVDT